MKRIKNAVAVILSLIICIGTVVPVLAAADTVLENNSYVTETVEGNLTSNEIPVCFRYGSVDQFFIQQNSDSTISKIVATNDGITIDNFSADYNYMSSKKIDAELPIFGGYYRSADYNFVVFGQENHAESDNVEVIRVVKYSHDWQRLGALSVYGANTVLPFDFGSCRMSDNDELLFIHTCHKMYRSSDGINHQANLQLYVRISDMSKAYIRDDVINIKYGYCSHSFDQYIEYNDPYVYSVDLGDAYPRSVVLCKKETTGKVVKYQDLIEIPGEIGDNETGITLGDFIVTDNNCIVVGTHADISVPDPDIYKRNIFMVIADKNLESADIIEITDFDRRSAVRKPEIIDLGDNTFYLLWNEKVEMKTTARIIKFDESGKVLEEYSIPFSFSECEPIIIGEELVWYNSDGKKTTFVHVDPSEYKPIQDINEQLLYSLDQDGNATITGISEYCQVTDLVIPEKIDNHPVVAIGDTAFRNTSLNFTSVEIPGTVKTIGSYAFFGQYDLENITLGEGIESLGDTCFGDTAIKQIAIPGSVKTIGPGVFFRCVNLETVKINEGTQTIGNNAFNGCTKLTTVYLPDSVSSLGVRCFQDTELSEFYIPLNVKDFSANILYGCNTLEKYTANPEHTQYATVDGVLYTKDMQTLIRYPFAKAESSLLIPDGVTMIESSAFSGCNTIEEVVLPMSIALVKSYAFQNCVNLKKVVFNNFIYYIGSYAFSGCTSLENISLDCQIIYNGAFKDCTALKSIGLTKQINSIADGAFANCTALRDVYYNYTEAKWKELTVEGNNECLLNATVHFAGEQHNHGYVSTVTTQPTCTSEGIETYICSCGDNFTKPLPAKGHTLSHITVESTCKDVGEEYDHCSVCDVKLNAETLPLAEHTWSEWTVTTEPTTENEGSKTRTCSVCSEEETESIPKLEEETVVNGTCGEKVTWTLNKETGELILEGSGEMTEYSYSYETSSTGAPWYEYRLLIKTVTIGDGITNAGEYSFCNCKNLTSVKLGDSVSKIGVSTFLAGDKYESITVDDNNKTYSDKDGVLYSKDMTKLIHYPCGRKNESYIFPESITYIEKYALRDCHYLKRATLPQSLTRINDRAFYFNKSIETVTISDSVTSIGERAFSGCYNLINITIPDTVTTIGRYAFNDTKYYKDVSKWENEVLYIGNHLIEAKNSLSGRYEIKDETKCIADYAFINCSNLTDVTIPDSVTSIGQRAFYGCAELEKVVIPDGITNIRDFTFKNCNNLTTIIIPDSVVSIDEAAFYGCSGIVDVYYNGTEEEWGKIEVKSGNSDLLNATIHFAESEHEHSYESEITTQPTCTAEGVETFTCECGDSYTQTVPEKGHTLSHITVESTCKVAGMEYDLCSECEGVFNSNKLALKDHTWGEWTVTAEPTTENEGSKTRTCSVCSEEETESIPKLEVIVNEETGIEIVFGEEYGDGVEVQASEVYDGKSFQLVEANYGNVKTTIFDISTTVDGVAVQPEGKVKVRIPLPEGFGAGKVVVCYVDSENGKVTSIPAKVVDGYVEFETDHFSHYALLATKGKVHSVKIDDIRINYKDTMIIRPEIYADDGVRYTVTYSASNPSVAQVNQNGKITATAFGRTTITCTVTDEYGNTVTEKVTVNVRYTFWQWIIMLFLFGELWY